MGNDNSRYDEFKAGAVKLVAEKRMVSNQSVKPNGKQLPIANITCRWAQI